MCFIDLSVTILTNLSPLIYNISMMCGKGTILEAMTNCRNIYVFPFRFLNHKTSTPEHRPKEKM